MVGFPNAKINLGLNILGKRNDGYHDISTCFYPVGWKDAIEIIPASAKNTSITVSGIPIPGTPDENLCFKAVSLIKKDFDIPDVQVHIHKMIPIGAGLGGGSSDAVATLKILDRMFNLFLDLEILTWYAVKLGSDCPFFLSGKPQMASGRGEVLTDINTGLAGKPVVIAYPGLKIDTPWAYESIIPGNREINIKEIIEHSPVNSWENLLVNDFEEVVFKKYPELELIKKDFYELGAAYVSMSGSGSGIYAIYNELPVDLPKFPDGYQVWTGIL